MRPGETAPPKQVFVLGPARSGTSILLMGIGRVFRLAGFGESHIIPIFPRLLKAFDQYKQALPPRVAVQAFDTDLLMEGFRPVLRNFYAAQFPGGRWIDKTPGAESIYAIPLILDVFPEARIILTNRNGIEVAQSFTRKFSTTVEKAAQAWMRAMEAIERAKPFPEAILALDQFDVANDPRGTAQAVAAHLGEPAHAEALHAYLSSERTDQKSNHDWSRRMTLAETNWSEDEKAQFRDICGKWMTAAGYPM